MLRSLSAVIAPPKYTDLIACLYTWPAALIVNDTFPPPLVYDLGVAQLNNRNDFSPCFLCRIVMTCFSYTLPLAISQTNSMCVIERISVSALNRIYITCTSTNYVDVPELPHPRGRGRSHS